jgi:dihydropteroate synthase
VHDFLQQRIQICTNAGIDPQRLYIDPGFGFGKTLQHNLQLMRQLNTLKDLGVPILIGVSRKSIIGAVLDKTTENRLHGGIGLAVWAYQQGAKMIRTHDVAATHDALKMVQAVMKTD